MLNEKQMAIVEALRSDARASLAAIARTKGIPQSTVFDYYKKLKKSVIKKHTTIPDFQQLGYPLRKKFLLRTRERKPLSDWIISQRVVNNISRTDIYDIVFDAFFRNSSEIEAFKEEINNFKPVLLKEVDLLETLKEEAFMPSLQDA